MMKGVQGMGRGKEISVKLDEIIDRLVVLERIQELIRDKLLTENKDMRERLSELAKPEIPDCEAKMYNRDGLLDINYFKSHSKTGQEDES